MHKNLAIPPPIHRPPTQQIRKTFFDMAAYMSRLLNLRPSLFHTRAQLTLESQKNNETHRHGIMECFISESKTEAAVGAVPTPASLFGSQTRCGGLGAVRDTHTRVVILICSAPWLCMHER